MGVIASLDAVNVASIPARVCLYDDDWNLTLVHYVAQRKMKYEDEEEHTNVVVHMLGFVDYID